MQNKFPKGHTIVVEVVSPIGEPIQPDGVRSRFASVIGVMVWDILDCSIQHWNDVPASEKMKLWNMMMEAFSFPCDSEELIKKLAMKQAAKSFQGWRLQLNTSFRLKGCTSFKEFGKMKPDQWQRFCEQKSTPTALALSVLNSELTKNIHPHRLGSAGYGSKVEKWRAEAEVAREAGVPYKYEGLEEHTLN